MDKIIGASGQRHLPVSVVVQQGQSDNAHIVQHGPQVGYSFQGVSVQANQNHVWLKVLGLGQDLLVSVAHADNGQLVLPFQKVSRNAPESLVVVHKQNADLDTVA
jgi:hypothetical protein